MRVIAIDGGDEKRDLCKKLGAEEFIDFTKVKDIPAEVMKITKYGAHGVLVTAASKEAYAQAPMLLRPQGTLVAVGLPPDPTVVAGAPPMLMCLKALNVVGSVVGTLVDVDEALDFTARDLVHVSQPWVPSVFANSQPAYLDERKARGSRQVYGANDGWQAVRESSLAGLLDPKSRAISVTTGDQSLRQPPLRLSATVSHCLYP